MKIDDIIENNKLIANFLGYTYYQENVYQETDLGLDRLVTILSKTPIQCETYDNGETYHLSELPNPDYETDFPHPRWRTDLKTLPWECLNDYLILNDIDFHFNWNSLMKVCKHIIDMYFDNRTKIFQGLSNCDIEKTYEGVVDFIKFWNDETKKKYIWTDGPFPYQPMPKGEYIDLRKNKIVL